MLRRLIALVLPGLVAFAPEAARADSSGFWLGTDVAGGLHARSQDRAAHALVGWEWGLLPWSVAFGPSSRLGVGPGARLAYDGGLQASAVVRVALTDANAERHTLYVQAGPLLAHGRAGLDLQVGTDWTWAALFLAVMDQTLDGGRSQVVVLAGGRVSLSFLALMSFWHVPT